MYITDDFKSNKVNISLEIFPPKPDVPMEKVLNTVDSLATTNPHFISVTYGAGGSQKGNTIEIASYIQNTKNKTAIAHLTCIGSTKQEIVAVLDELKSKNITNILALRGDFPAHFSDEDKNKTEIKYASDLVKIIKDYGGFCIGGACYPEGHVETDNRFDDIDNLKYKIDAGVDFLISQLFFDNNMLYNFIYRMLKKNIDVPVCAGIMPVINKKSISRMCSLSGATLTPKFRNMLDRFSDNPEALKQAGIAYATEQIIDLISNGVNNIHLYTMNKPEIANKIIDNLKGII